MKTLKVEEVKVGMIAGRHDLPVDNYIFEEIENVFSFKTIRSKIIKFIQENFKYKDSFKNLIVYVTGLTPVTAEIVSVCIKSRVALTLMHYDKYSGKYIPQYIGIYTI